VAKHLIDTDLYIDLIQSGTTLSLIRELYDKDAPGSENHPFSGKVAWPL
jgi:hypothetical protein